MRRGLLISAALAGLTAVSGLQGAAALTESSMIVSSTGHFRRNILPSWPALFILLQH
jgi:hypothetical protein